VADAAPITAVGIRKLLDPKLHNKHRTRILLAAFLKVLAESEQKRTNLQTGEIK
jgi:hypothetical protein